MSKRSGRSKKSKAPAHIVEAKHQVELKDSEIDRIIILLDKTPIVGTDHMLATVELRVKLETAKKPHPKKKAPTKPNKAKTGAQDEKPDEPTPQQDEVTEEFIAQLGNKSKSRRGAS